ncbi:MAG: T9SS type A sorting domain-containing protein [Ignavibacteriales bacterium]|nr:T9SS type A sorting domain-containing protein [Ignavibacteriales bacterium]
MKEKIIYRALMLILMLLICFFPIIETNGQVTITGSLKSYITSYINNIPGSAGDNYQLPDDNEFLLARESIRQLLEENSYAADSLAFLFGYRVISYIDTFTTPTSAYLILEKHNSSNYWGIYIFNTQPKRQNLVLEVPHPLYDRNTGTQSLHIFMNSGAKALFISGTHRCNSSLYTDCSGTTTACNSSSESYRISDQAHSVNGLFQAGTIEVDTYNPNTIFLQLHGFSKLSTDPYMIMSNGTKSIPGNDLLYELALNIQAADPVIDFVIAHRDAAWTRLIATSNTQGRFINRSSNPCFNNATYNSGRFLHIEQAYSRLRDSESNWNKMLNAVNAVIPEDSTTFFQEPADLVPQFQISHNYPNPFNPSTNFIISLNDRQHIKVEIIDALGRNRGEISDKSYSSGNHNIAIDVSKFQLVSGVYYCKFSSENYTIVKKILFIK